MAIRPRTASIAMTTSNSIRVKPTELVLLARIRVLMILTTEKVFWKIFFNFRIGHFSKTYATSGGQTYPADFICKDCVWLARAREFGGFPLKRNETVVKKFDSFSFYNNTCSYVPVGVEGTGIERHNCIRRLREMLDP